MSTPNLTLHRNHALPIQAGMEVFTPRGFGTIVGPFVGDHFLSGPKAYWVELDDDQGRAVVKVADLQVAHVGS